MEFSTENSVLGKVGELDTDDVLVFSKQIKYSQKETKSDRITTKKLKGFDKHFLCTAIRFECSTR